MINENVIKNILPEIRSDLVEILSELDRLEQRYTKAGAKRLRRKMLLFCKNRINYSKALIEAEKGYTYIFEKITDTKAR